MGKVPPVVEKFVSFMFLIITTLSYLPLHTAWYIEAVPQLVHVHHILRYCGEVAVSECSVCEGIKKDVLKIL